MSVDLLQEKIRKLKNPSMVEFFLEPSLVPPQVLAEAENPVAGYCVFCRSLLQGLKETVPAVRFSMGSFALAGAAGMEALSELMAYARKLGFYVVMDAPELLSPAAAQLTADTWAAGLPCDGLIVSVYSGGDMIRPFLPACKEHKAVFAVVRTANKTAPELQDLLTGSRHVHTAAAGMVMRHGEPLVGKYGYSQLGVLMGATGADSIRSLRSKYDRLFFLIDGYDYSGANAKNCSYGFDRLGRGAVVCAGASVTAAWKESGETAESYVDQAVQAALRMKKNITRYITVL